MNEKRYITTTLPYVNAQPHIGFAMEIVRADVLARFWRQQGHEVFFNTGTDEHGQKIYQKAQELGIDPQLYCDEQVRNFLQLKPLLNLSWDNFIRTTDEHHIQAAQKFWQICELSGYIYKKKYKIKYCVGCELEKTDSELDHGRCPLHPNQELEIIEEENYFFKFSQFSQQLLDFYEKNPGFVQPEQRYREVKSFVQQGLQDFSISRLKSKMPWGVEVPGDQEQVMYVWFDALVNYISALGWSDSAEATSGEPAKFDEFWPGCQICGKDNLRQQAAMWQAMLMAAGIANSQRIYVNGFINVAGQKMSKSLGNVITPMEMVEKFGVDATRYLLLSLGVFGEDWDVTWERMIEKYNADLANGIGNLSSRIITLYGKLDTAFDLKTVDTAMGEMTVSNIESMRLDNELADIYTHIKGLDKYVEQKKPWELAKSHPEEFKQAMEHLVRGLYEVASRLEPFMPETSQKIKQSLETKEVGPLFQRIK